jgi:putative ABC transport system permease protein
LLISLGDTVKASITTEISSFGANNISISPGRNFAASSGSKLTKKDLDVVLNIAKTYNSQVSWQSGTNGTVSNGSISANASTIGASPSYFDISGLKVTKGRTLNQTDDDNTQRVAVLGSVLSDKLFPNEDPIGKQIHISNASFTIVGVLEAGGTGLNNTDNNCIIPITTLQTYLTGQTSISQMTVKLSDNSVITEVQDRIKAELRVSRGLTPTQELDFQATTFASALSTLNTVLSTLTAFLAAVAAISLIVGGIGIMNIMFVTVTERTKEIGLRKALGANNSNILVQFLTEAVFLTMLGGIIGLVIGVSLSLLISQALGLTAIISLDSVILVLSVSISIGLIFGIYPARRSSKLTPIEALRFE